MLSLRAANDVPIPGYRLHDRLGEGGFGEVWKCEAPGGLWKAIKFVSGCQGEGRAATDADNELRALALLKSIAHPFLLSIERVETLPDGDLAIVTELAECSLHDVLEKHRAAGLPGVPRAEALAYLREAAEVLDLMNQEHGLQHLDIKPRNLFLVQKHVKVGDFGMVASLADLYGNDKKGLNGVTPLYAAPEVFQDRVTLFTDQFSLAVTYHELVTGAVVFQGANLCAQIFLVSTKEPDLSGLDESDRPAVARALSKDPRDRFPNCTTFAEALLAAGPPASGRFLRSRTTSFDLAAIDVTQDPKPAPAAAPRNLSDTARAPVAPAATAVVRKPRPTFDVPAPGAGSVLPGVQLQECLQRGSQGEWWRATGARGGARLVRFLTEAPDGSSNDELVARLLAFDHPALAEVKALPAGPGRLAIISEAGDRCLATLLRDSKAQGRPGLGRDEALSLLGAVASSLDELHADYELQHLVLSPRHIAVSRGSLILLEYGMGELCWLPRGLSLAAINPRYAAAEQFHGLISPASDQYSLALIYAELVLGLYPFRNLNARQMLTARSRAEPDLSLLPGPERLPLLKALSPEPERRFARCADLFLALQEGAGPASREPVVRPAALSEVSAPGPPPAPPGEPLRASLALLEELIVRAARGHEVRGAGLLYYRITPGHSIEHRCNARLAPGMARLKLGGFRERWQAEVLHKGHSRWAYFVRGATSFWRGWLGHAPGLHVEVTLGTARDDLTPIRVTLEPMGCSAGKGAEILDELGPPVLASLQTYFASHSTRAEQERFPVAGEVFIEADAAGLQLPGRLRDIGRDGLALYVPRALPGGTLTLTLQMPGTLDTLRLVGRARDCLPCAEGAETGQHEVEVTLLG